jgi:hypothetical protein
MRYARMALLLATAACAMAVATPAPGQAVSTGASAYSNSVAAAPKMRHATRRLDTAQAQIHPERAPGYGSMQAIGHWRPTQDDLQPTEGDVEKIDKDNQQLDLPASQNEITGAGQVQSEEDALTNRIRRSNPALDSEIMDICPSCGSAEDARVHQRSWPTYNGSNHKPTQYEPKALHQQDVTRRQVRETNLYDRLTSNQIRGRRPAPAP